MNTYHNWIKNDEKLQIIIFCKTTLNLFLIHILMLQYQNLFQHLTPTTMVKDILYLTSLFHRIVWMLLHNQKNQSFLALFLAKYAANCRHRH